MNDELATALGPTTSRSYRCACNKAIFLRNTQCLNCARQLGYHVEGRTMLAIEPAPQPERWVLARDAAVAAEPTTPLFQRCANFATASNCNWLIPAGTAEHPHAPENLTPGFCLACTLTRTIPDMSSPVNQELWRKLEIAKRRLLSQLLSLALPVETRLERPNGLAFDLLENVPGGPAVLTGHDEGLITLNIAEADDAEREKIRAAMHESYRTLLGHYRHEIGHYYWDRLVKDTAWLAPCRELFGDETVDYAESLQRHYKEGPPADWPLHYVTSYATTHPWEDWAETWAHYLHMADTVDTAVSFGLDANSVDIESDPYTLDDLWKPDDPNAEHFLRFLNSWVLLTSVLNELTRSMGQPDYYPFVLPREAIGKLHFIHEVIRSASTGVVPEAPTQAAPAPSQSQSQSQSQSSAPSAPAAQPVQTIEAAPVKTD
ncbi:hypothetical protein RD110_04535 [Rhodoferax koreense]|uniref:Zinc-ribbon domain-containing protein n=1 Tax=Rhodoferax koreensis TaxID=1842727 RepID=A0A1P8JS22_9BURK|nr:putative zinc-binding metallopeptidase [Rhodoferax koreense]APW36564.1 hypothetical protein RD110_04535 [Rhodoferax koreense]